jgi:hypothetical protein
LQIDQVYSVNQLFSQKVNNVYCYYTYILPPFNATIEKHFYSLDLFTMNLSGGCSGEDYWCIDLRMLPRRHFMQESPIFE